MTIIKFSLTYTTSEKMRELSALQKIDFGQDIFLWQHDPSQGNKYCV